MSIDPVNVGKNPLMDIIPDLKHPMKENIVYFLHQMTKQPIKKPILNEKDGFYRYFI
jgi:hypothetical protein